MKKEYNLLEGTVTLDNCYLKITHFSIWKSIRDKILSIIAAFYIYDRLTLNLEKKSSHLEITWIIILYGSLSIFILLWIFHSWFKSSWTNKIKIENIKKVIIYEEDTNPLNIDLEIKSKLNTIGLKFRKTEEDYQKFIFHLKKLNSKINIKDERIQSYKLENEFNR